MTVWEELKARGLIAQVTDEDEIKEMVNNGKATFYIGFDPTADSLSCFSRPFPLYLPLTTKWDIWKRLRSSEIPWQYLFISYR